MKFKPQKRYAGPGIGVIGSAFLEATKETVTSFPGWADIPFGFLAIILGAFLLGEAFADFSDRRSAFRKRIDRFRTLFRVEKTVPVSRSDNAVKEWIEPTVFLEFTRKAKGVDLTLRVFDCRYKDYPQGKFLLLSKHLDLVHEGQKEKIQLAVIPTKRHDGKPLGYQCWGNRYRESGDTVDMRALSPGSMFVIKITVESGWRRQSENIYIHALHREGYGEGKLVMACNSHPNRPFEILDPEEA